MSSKRRAGDKTGERTRQDKLLVVLLVRPVVPLASRLSSSLFLSSSSSSSPFSVALLDRLSFISHLLGTMPEQRQRREEESGVCDVDIQFTWAKLTVF